MMGQEKFKLTHEVRVQIGQRLETLCEKSGLEQNDIAGKAGFATRHFQRALKGEMDVSENALNCFATVLGTTLDELYAQSNRTNKISKDR